MVLFLTSLLKTAFPQAQGIFIYEDDYSDALATGKVVTKIYESKSMARIESTNTATKSALGEPTTKDQDVILLDLDKLSETHLSAERKTAITTPFTTSYSEDLMKKMGTEVTIQNLGPEKIGNYNCTHFVINTVTKNKSLNYETRKDIWTTKDLGTGNVYYVGHYLYYPKGSQIAGKLTQAGADGIVVRWQVLDPSTKKPNVCNLVRYQPGPVPASDFSAPSGYTAFRH